MNDLTTSIQPLFSRGFPTNRIPVKIPSTGQDILLRETTVVELKSMGKTIIDNFGRRQMDVIYDAATEYLQSMVLTDGIDIWSLTEFDRLYMLMVFFQMSFYKEPMNYKCPHCGVDVVYRYDMAKYLQKMDDEAYVEDQTAEIPYKSRMYEMVMGWPDVRTMSRLTHHFYSEMGQVTEEMERTQFGIQMIMSFIKKVKVYSMLSPDGGDSIEVDLTQMDSWQDRLDCINALPSMVVFDDRNGVFSKVTGWFINRLENCFFSETCPQCHKETNYGLPQSSLFHGLFCGSLKSLYSFIIQVESFLMYKYDCSIFRDEQYMTYNDLNVLVHQLSTTMEKENEERKKMNKDNFTKGLWYIREILNSYIFPQDKKK